MFSILMLSFVSYGVQNSTGGAERLQAKQINTQVKLDAKQQTINSRIEAKNKN